MTENIDPNDIEDCQKQVFDLEAEVRELRAALEAASVSVSRMTNRALKQELRAERAEAVLEQVQNALLVRDHQYQATKAALEQARALVAKWEAEAEQTGSWERLDTLSDCADDLAAALASGGAA